MCTRLIGSSPRDIRNKRTINELSRQIAIATKGPMLRLQMSLLDRHRYPLFHILATEK